MLKFRRGIELNRKMQRRCRYQAMSNLLTVIITVFVFVVGEKRDPPPALYPWWGMGHPLPPIAMVYGQQLGIKDREHAEGCDEGKEKSVKVAEWWKNYFENGTEDPDTFADLYKMVKEKTELHKICLAGFRLYTCSSEKRCICRPETTAIEIPNIASTHFVDEEDTISHCLINKDAYCAQATQPGDFATHKATRRMCATNLCCSFQWNTGKSKCTSCRKEDP